MVAPVLPVTALYAALLGFVLLALTVLVIQHRRRVGMGIGDGGDRGLQRAIRAHGNAAETIPVLLILLALVELSAYPAALVHGLGMTILLSRLLHAFGMSRRSGASFGRITGMALSLLLMLAMPLLLLARVAGMA